MFALFLKLTLLSFAANTITSPWELPLRTFFGYATILFSFALPFSAVKADLTLKIRNEAKYALIFCATLFVSFIMSIPSSSITIDYIRDVLSLFCMYCALSIKSQHLSFRDLIDILRINNLLSWAFVAYILLPFSFTYTTADVWGNRTFTLGMGNTNGTSLILFFCLAIQIIEFSFKKHLVSKLIKVFIIIVLLYGIVRLKSRTVLLCAFFVILASLLRSLTLKIWMAEIVQAIPFLFIPTQILLGKSSHIMILGKTIASGRQQLFSDYFTQIVSYPWKYILGAIGEHHLENAHNAPLGIFLNLGIVGLVAFIFFWKAFFRNAISNCNTDMVKRLSIFSLLACVIHSASEGGPMIGIILYSTPILILSRLAKDSFCSK